MDKFESVLGISPDQHATKNGSSQAQEEKIYRPTLVIGVGGTGTRVVKRLKNLMAEKLSDNPAELFQFLALDTEPEILEPPWLGVDEFVNLAEMTILGNRIVETMMKADRAHIYRGLAAWWPRYANGEPFLPGDITSGAKATRCIGRLALWSQGMNIYRKIENKVNTTLQIRELHRTDIPATGNAAKVFIICSLAGGTGSGIYLDVAYMVRQILEELNIIPFITGLLLVDTTPFAQIIQEEGLLRRMDANIYAALCELDYFMGGHQSLNGNHQSQSAFRYDLQYINQLRVQSNAKPFEVCYPLTATNEHSRRMRNIEGLTEMMAQEIFLEIASPLGRAGRSALDNVERLSLFSQYGPRPLAYSGFAVSSLNLSPELISRQCVLGLTAHALNTLAAPNGRAIDLSQVAEQLNELALNQDEASDLLRRHMRDDLQRLLPELTFSTNSEASEYLIEANDLHEELLHILSEIIQPKYDDAPAALIQQYQQKLDAILLKLISRGDVSLAQVSEFIKSLLEKVQTTREEIAKKRQGAQQAVKQAEEQVEYDSIQLQQESETPERRLFFFPTNKPRRVARAARELLSSLESLQESQVDAYRWQTLDNLFERVDDQWRDYNKNASDLRADLERMHKEIVKHQQKVESVLGEGRYQLEFGVLDAAGIQSYLLSLWQERDDLRERVAQAIQGGVAGRLSGRQTSNQIVEHLYNDIRTLWHTQNLFDILNQIHKDNHSGIERQLKKLVEYTAPFWHLTLTNCPGAIDWSVISIMGYDKKSSLIGSNHFETILHQVIDRYAKVHINDSNRLIFLNTKHGAPLFALSLTNGMMRDAYYIYRNGWLDGQPGIRPIHLSDEWWNLPDFNPEPI